MQIPSFFVFEGGSVVDFDIKARTINVELLSVGAGSPAGCHTRSDTARFVERGQAFAQVAQNSLGLDRASLLRIQGVRLRSGASQRPSPANAA